MAYNTIPLFLFLRLFHIPSQNFISNLEIDFNNSSASAVLFTLLSLGFGDWFFYLTEENRLVLNQILNCIIDAAVVVLLLHITDLCFLPLSQPPKEILADV